MGEDELPPSWDPVKTPVHHLNKRHKQQHRKNQVKNSVLMHPTFTLVIDLCVCCHI